MSFYNYDGHGSVRNLTNSNAQITDTYDYDAFGNLIAQTGNTSNSYFYAGEQFDVDLGFYYNRARYLNVQTGRFISQDSFEGSQSDPFSLHKYLYANADGVNKIDPSGNVSLAQALIVINIIGVLASYLFQNTTRAIAPGNDRLENYYYETQADYRDAQINLAFLIFALAQVTAGARVAGSNTIGTGGGRVTPYNPSGGGQNCAACVFAVIKTRKTGVFTTADEIEAIRPAQNLPNARATADYIEETAGVSLVDSTLYNGGPGQYIIVREPTNLEQIGHVVYAYVNRYGRRYILDPQTNRAYFLPEVGQGLQPEVRQLIGSSPVVLKVQE